MKKLFNYFLITPTEYTIGNASEDIFYAILYTLRKENKLLILYRKPTFLRWFFNKYVNLKKITNTEIFQLTSTDSIIINNSKKYIFIFSYILDTYYLFIYLLNKTIIRFINFYLKKLGFKIINISNIPIYNRKYIYNINNDKNFYKNNLNNQRWDYFLNIEFNLQIRNESKGDAILSEMGLTKSDWFVCVHVRELGFHSDTTFEGSYRCANINSYDLAFDYIEKMGGYIIRMGDPSMKNINSTIKLIDYANSKYKSDFMDLYLIKNCKYYIGMDSGIYDTAILFQKPVLLANITCLWFATPLKRNDLYIIKHIYSKRLKRQFSISEILDLPFDVCFHFYNDLTYNDSDYLFIDNSDIDILNLLVEKINMSNNYKYTELQISFLEKRQKQILKWVKEEKLFKEDVTLAYRFAIRIYYQGVLSNNFLQKYWK